MWLKLRELRSEAPITNEEIHDWDRARKLTQKDYVNTEKHAVESQVEVGDQILLRNTKTNKMSPNYDASPCDVMDRNRGDITLRKTDGLEIKRNVSFVNKYQENGTSESESESVAPLQPNSSPSESWYHFNQLLASQLIAQFQCSRQLTHLMLKTSLRQTRTS